ncbi:hypothetical protein DFJ73DRAFT_807556, partial [Zopfochytrium polystomum]
GVSLLVASTVPGADAAAGLSWMRSAALFLVWNSPLLSVPLLVSSVLAAAGGTASSRSGDAEFCGGAGMRVGFFV